LGGRQVPGRPENPAGGSYTTSSLTTPATTTPSRKEAEERTFSWLSRNRRMSKDYERLCATAEAFVYVAITRLMVRWLACA
jgi:Transposase DDE domain